MPLRFEAFRGQNSSKQFKTGQKTASKGHVHTEAGCFGEDVDVDERSAAVFISLEKFETFAAEYFAYRNIPRAYRLAC